MSKSICTAYIISIIFFPFSLSASQVDRPLFFENCRDVVSNKKVFRAYDKGEIKTFRLSSNVYRGEGFININLIFDEIERRGFKIDSREIAYVLGTVFRETVGTMRPVHEVISCKDEECIHKYVGNYGQRKNNNGKSYYGRGFSQLTHDYNYLRFGKLLNMQPETKLYDNPDLALDPHIASAIIIIGMYEGAFTNKYKLSDFFNEADSTAKCITQPE